MVGRRLNHGEAKSPEIFAPDRSVWIAEIVFRRQPPSESKMNATIAVTPEVTTLVNVLTVEPENQSQLLESLRANTDNVVRTLPGWISTSFVVSHDRRHVLIYSQWRNLASIRGMQAHPEMRAYFPHVAALASFDSISGDVVYSRHA
jgi:quinol monooxygenase YgiN